MYRSPIKLPRTVFTKVYECTQFQQMDLGLTSNVSTYNTYNNKPKVLSRFNLRNNILWHKLHLSSQRQPTRSYTCRIITGGVSPNILSTKLGAYIFFTSHLGPYTHLHRPTFSKYVLTDKFIGCRRFVENHNASQHYYYVNSIIVIAATFSYHTSV